MSANHPGATLEEGDRGDSCGNLGGRRMGVAGERCRDETAFAEAAEPHRAHVSIVLIARNSWSTDVLSPVWRLL